MSVGTSAFARALADLQPDPAGRRWLSVPDDQLSDAMGPLAGEDTHGFGIGLGERTGKAAMAAADREPGRRGSAPKARGRDHEGLSRGRVAMTKSGPIARR